MRFFQSKAFAVPFFIILFCYAAAAQTMIVRANRLDDAGSTWKIDFSFSVTVNPNQIGAITLISTPGQNPIKLSQPFGVNSAAANSTSVFNIETLAPLDFTKYSYDLTVEVTDNGQTTPVKASVVELDSDKALNRVVKGKAKEADDADVYISGSINGARKQKTRFSTQIKVEHYFPIGSWRYAPFFRLNASTDPDADPDKMEFGLNFRRVIGSDSSFLSGYYFDNAIKIESERDFENTNFIYDTRLTFLPAAFPKGTKTKTKIFIDPFIGGEFGKNLKSPLPAARKDGIARGLAGATLRFVYFADKEKGQGFDWNTTYTRRWLLSDELGYKADDDGNLQLIRFGKSPRDFLSSKFIYNFNKFAGLLIKYEWGQEPPSYKLVDHRFNVGFVYKFARIVK